MNGYLKLLARIRWKAFFLPILAGFIFLTCSSYYTKNLYDGDMETIRMYVVPNFHLIISLLSAWWGILAASNYVSEKGNEVLYMYFNTKSLITCQFSMEAVYILLFTAFFLLLQKDFGFTFFMLALLIGESMFLSGLAFGIIHLTKNTSIALGVIAFYCIYLLKFDSLHVLQGISIFYDLGESASVSCKPLVIDFGFAALFHVMGVIFFKIRKVYF